MDVTGKIETRDPDAINKEVKKIYEQLFGLALPDKVENVLGDIVDLFHGKYDGYQSCDTEYHNLEHTLQAYLAMARIFDGMMRQNPERISKEIAVLGLISALGHDTGFIKETGDNEGTGAKYSLTHVERSNEFMGKYLPRLNFSAMQIRQVQRIISCTGIDVDLSEIPFTSVMEKEVGHILGTADYLGQMSDPDYLEKLPLLYEEFKEGGVPGYNSAQDLMKRTPQFFDDFVMKRLVEDYHSVYRYAADHFGGINLYIVGIKRNIESLITSIK